MHKTKVTIGKSNLDTKQWQIGNNKDRSKTENENKRNPQNTRTENLRRKSIIYIWRSTKTTTKIK